MTEKCRGTESHCGDLIPSITFGRESREGWLVAWIVSFLRRVPGNRFSTKIPGQTRGKEDSGLMYCSVFFGEIYKLNYIISLFFGANVFQSSLETMTF